MELKQIIKVIIPETKQQEALEIVERIQNEEYNELFDKYGEKLGLSYSYNDVNEFIEGVEDEEIDLNTTLVWYMAAEELLLQLDWSGEEDNEQVEDFVNMILRHIYKEKFTVNSNEIYDMFNKDEQNKNPSIKRGEHLPIIFKHINKQLKKHGYQLINFNDNSDQYFVGIFKQDIVEKIINEGLDVFNIVDVDDI